MTATTALERVVRRARATAAEALERCELCAVDIGPQHRHLLDTQRSGVLCVCYACSVLFNRDAASQGHYMLVPERRVPLPGVDARTLGMPVGLAFLTRQADGVVVAHYPSPGGATQWILAADTWHALTAQAPVLAGLAPYVEALLVDTARGRDEHWLVPIDDCYRLVALVRQHWRGMYGGDEVWNTIRQFFAALRSRYGPDTSRQT